MQNSHGIAMLKKSRRSKRGESEYISKMGTRMHDISDVESLFTIHERKSEETVAMPLKRIVFVLSAEEKVPFNWND